MVGRDLDAGRAENVACLAERNVHACDAVVAVVAELTAAVAIVLQEATNVALARRGQPQAIAEIDLGDVEGGAGSVDGPVVARSEQRRQPADVIVVTVGEHDGVDAAGVVEAAGGVGVAPSRHAAIDEQRASWAVDPGHRPGHGAPSAEEGDVKVFRGVLTCGRRDGSCHVGAPARPREKARETEPGRAAPSRALRFRGPGRRWRRRRWTPRSARPPRRARSTSCDCGSRANATGGHP